MRFLFSFFSPPHRFYVSLPPRRKDEDTQRSNFNRKIVNRKIVNITMILFFRTPSKSVIAVECNHELPQADSDKLCWLFGEATPESEDNHRCFLRIFWPVPLVHLLIINPVYQSSFLNITFYLIFYPALILYWSEFRYDQQFTRSRKEKRREYFYFLRFSTQTRYKAPKS